MVFLPLCSLVYCGPFARIYELVECFRMLSHAHSHVPLTIPESHGGARILSPAALSRSFPQAPLVRCLHSIDIIPLTLLPFFFVFLFLWFPPLSTAVLTALLL